MRKGTKQCPKCTRTFNKMGIATHISHCKGVADRKFTPKEIAQINKDTDMFNQASVKTAVENSSGWQPTPINHEEEYRKLASDYKKLLTENEGLRRVIGTQKEVVNSLCHAIVEANSVEGRWR